MFSLFKKEKGPEYISGRIASKEDVKFGFFCVVTESGEVISAPYDVSIPQKVVHINQETKERNKGKLIQAEQFIKTESKGQIICTVRLEDDSTLVCKLEELELSEK